jgi:tRNA-modifying protein YgfZ
MTTLLPLTPASYCLLTDDALVTARGAESVSFLQNQLTNDVVGLPDQGAQLNGYCNVKGRLYATFLLIKQGVDVDLIFPADIAEVVRKRLSMFVMRAKTKLSFDEDRVLIGLSNPPPTLVGETSGLAIHQSVQLPLPYPATLVRLADALGIARYLLLVAKIELAEWEAYLQLQTVAKAAVEQWRDLELSAGIARVGAGITELFVPQMLNFELLGGVNFKKGCYPGQEVVARSQYLGKMKRRMFLFSASLASADQAVPFALAADVVRTQDAAQIEGQVVGIAISGTTVHLQVETSTDVFAAVQAGELSLSAGGLPLLALPQPYSLPVHESLKRVL